MTDASNESAVTIPKEVRKQFPELCDLILQSESMNDEERQYWINILPIMTPEQVDNLRNILMNEKKQLAEIDKKYSSHVDIAAAKEEAIKTEQEMRIRREERKEQEMSAEEIEEKKTEELLKKIEEL